MEKIRSFSFPLLLGGIIFIYSCSSSSKMGKINYGKNGVIESGSGISRCTHPTKRYTKSIEAKVKASIDSLSNMPKADLDADLQQTVTRLADYSSDGLDIDLILFQICEISNNRGLNAAQTDTLMKIALDAWNLKKYPSVSVINNGVNNGIMAGTVVVPEDKDIPLVNNFEIVQVADSHLISKNHIGIEIKPKQGVWSIPYFAYPLNEDSIVNGQISSRTSSMFNSGDATITMNGRQINVRILSNPVAPSNQYYGSIFSFINKPSILFFGDANNPTKMYSIKL